MLQLRPNCEQCNKTLAPDSDEAMMCSYECTYCRDCVKRLHNVCPNCGGGFVERPIRPTNDYIEGVSLKHQPASTKNIHKMVDLDEHAKFAASIRNISPDKR
ncbi:MAG: DUF1272 domain-containing protein [Gammaproteobacteria bacterium]|nr:DUF1272 domain-containing protein [Gammaproteobacteria bacterium]NNC96966.1 DUF1272 domain-containing protein [Gammaproteobacteria bacterium]NNM13411.1 DUF1272 domain-containing protein [Gammaproteobacteria bacterium]